MGTMSMTVNEYPMKVLEYVQEVTIDAPREKVFDIVTQHVGEWFTPRFLEGTKVVSEPWVGGRLYEDAGNGAGVLWDICTAFVPPEYVVYESPWGFAAGTATIVVSYRFAEASGGKTTLTSKHKIIGAMTDEMAASYQGHISTPEMAIDKLLNDYIATLE
jgi:uncharacterized protein YndB with AHSA1/START domain